MKTCNICKLEKPKTEFSRRSASLDGLQRACKPCKVEACASWRIKNESERAEYFKKYRKENSGRLLAYSKLWAKLHPDECAQRGAAWRKENPERVSMYNRNRRALKLLAYGEHTDADVCRIFSSQRGLCASCGVKLIRAGNGKYHVDHITPLSMGGHNDKYNLQCLCPTCNLRKNAKDPLDWAKENWKIL